MTFKDLKSGYPIYLLDRTALKYEQGKIMAVGLPHADVQPGSYGKMLVDITIQTADGKQNTYSVNDSEQVAYAGVLLLTCNKDCIINEVRAINAQAEEILSKVSDNQTIVTNCKALLEELDTTFRDKQETEKRFHNIDERFSAIESKMDKILAAISNKF